VTVEQLRPRVKLRQARDEDMDRLREWRNDPEAVRFSVSGTPVTAEEHATWFATRRRDPAARIWIAEEEGSPVGQVRLDVEDGVGSVSIAIAPAHRRRGVGSSVLRAVLEAAANDPKIQTLRALTHPDNLPSRRAFERVGFRTEGTTNRGFIVLERPVERVGRNGR
jgi:RimJ/RimL family protein N-acetyltransferase